MSSRAASSQSTRTSKSPNIVGPELGRLGDFIRSQRRLAQLSQRELARLTNLSDPYVSQLERGLHAPSLHVLRAMASALEVSIETLLVHAGILERDEDAPEHVSTEFAIRNDPRLDDTQKEALLSVYRSFVGPDAE